MFSLYLDIEDAVKAKPLTEPRRTLGTELFTRITIELKPQPTLNFKGKRMPINRGHSTVDLKICQSRRLISNSDIGIKNKYKNTVLYFRGNIAPEYH